MENKNQYTCTDCKCALPCNCPACGCQLSVKSLCCENCNTEVNGFYKLPVLSRLAAADQDFVLQFIICSGSLKDMAKYLKLSYPTVRNLLDEIIKKINEYEGK
ncbi:MAG: DUF2089 domain-containing protein [Dysgonamonadaceae bacterium]|jgi:hypothetical protein|nr:DUF2089 domain-containing protein [Dysgonamonadaceae bacterium]